MSTTVGIEMLIYEDNTAQLDKLISPRPHASRGDDFRWTILNDTGGDIAVTLANFNPSGYVYFAPNAFPLNVPDGQKRQVKGKVVNAVNGADTRVVYEVLVGNQAVDPDLIIDGDPIGPGGPKGPIGKKKANGAKAGGKKGGRKRAAKHR
jgi:hypothetical protein